MAHGIATKLAANALIESGHSRRAVARQLKISPNSVSAWNQDKRYELIPPKEIDQIKSSLIGHAYKNAYRLERGITDEKISQASVLQLSTAYGIHIDKARLMSNESTNNISHNGVIQNLDNDRVKLMEKLKMLEENQ